MEYEIRIRGPVLKSEGDSEGMLKHEYVEGYLNDRPRFREVKDIAEYLTLKEGVTSCSRLAFPISNRKNITLITMQELTLEQIQRVSDKFSKVAENKQKYTVEIQPIGKPQ